jgi:TRAP-type transport system periplasmic protein
MHFPLALPFRRLNLLGTCALAGTLLCSFAGALPGAEKVLNLKLATLAPSGSSYHQNLQAMGEQWRKASNGALKLTIFAGGVQGSEADTVGLMQTGSLDAGLLTAVGLSEIERSVNGLQSMPMVFRSLEEVDYVGDKLRPELEQQLLAKGYLVLFWTDSGWVRFFTKSPVLHPDDMRKLKIITWAGNAGEYDLWKLAGFNPVALETKDMAQGLFSGTASAVCSAPVFALFSQLDTQAKYMIELNWAPLVGACVVRKKSWDRIDPQTREALLKIASEAGGKIKAAGRAESLASVSAMEKRGLKVQPVTPEVEEEWRAAAAKVLDQLRGAIVPAEMYDRVQALLKEYRASKGAAK